MAHQSAIITHTDSQNIVASQAVILTLSHILGPSRLYRVLAESCLLSQPTAPLRNTATGIQRQTPFLP